MSHSPRLLALAVTLCFLCISIITNYNKCCSGTKQQANRRHYSDSPPWSHCSICVCWTFDMQPHKNLWGCFHHEEIIFDFYISFKTEIRGYWLECPGLTNAAVTSSHGSTQKFLQCSLMSEELFVVQNERF